MVALFHAITVMRSIMEAEQCMSESEPYCVPSLSSDLSCSYLCIVQHWWKIVPLPKDHKCRSLIRSLVKTPTLLSVANQQTDLTHNFTNRTKTCGWFSCALSLLTLNVYKADHSRPKPLDGLGLETSHSS